MIIDISGSHGTDPFPMNASATLNVLVVSIGSSFDGVLNCLRAVDQHYLRSAYQDCYKQLFVDITN